MLPASNVRGHKEWAPGRKSDPTYSMSWRRGRVADFKPRTTTVAAKPTPKPAPPEDDMAQVSQQAFDQLVKDVATIKTALTGDLESLGAPGLKAKPSKFLLWIDRHAYQLNRLRVPYAVGLLEHLARKAGATEEELAKVKADAEAAAKA